MVHVWIDGDKNGVAFTAWGMRGYVVEENMNATVVLQNASSILAANKTHRIDPRAKFTYYEGGWNIADEHYHSVSSSQSVFHSLPCPDY